MAIFKGAGVALITPFKDDLTVDYDQLRKLVDFQIENGTDAIIVCGTTGESSTLSEEEHSEAIRVVAEHTAGRVPVIAGTGSNDTQTAIKLSKDAEKDLIQHYTAIAEAVNIPIILYNVPSRTGCNIEPETAVYLAKNVKNIVAIKEASGNISQVAKLMALADGCIDLYSGNDDQILPLLSLGGIGVISVTSNIIPQDTHQLVHKFLNGDVAGSRELQLKCIDLCKALFCEVNPIPVKKATAFMGLSNGKVRMPLSEMEDANAAKLEKAMREYGIQF